MTERTSPDIDRLRRVDAIFERALEVRAEEREGYLAEACGDDAEMKSEVEGLLAAADTADSPIDAPGGAIGGTVSGWLADRLDTELPLPQRIGPYRPTRLLGRGGMAVVYLAERADGHFEQEVAIKVIGGLQPSPAAMRLFERERQILASLEHPGIARLLDGGVTEQGHPYLVMERVQGMPIDQHCDARALSVEERLRLFLDVVEAVQHAHRRLVLHRDLKPSNILVTEDGRVKLLDFGIAGLLHGGDEPAPTMTAAGMMTPEYASPEQIAGERMTTASDVYQLGLLLYRLLTGCHAYDVDSRSPGLVERTIRETAAVAPSTRLARGPRKDDESWAPEAVAQARGVRLQSLVRQLRGDIDTIVLMALRKEPERRYDSAAELAEDVRRHLDGLPVRAHPDSFGYRLRKLVVRQKLAFAVAFGAVVFIGYHLAVVQARNRAVTAERDRARVEAARANEIRSFLTGLFESADPERSLGQELTVREVLDQGSVRIESELVGQPEVRSEMLATIGEIYRSLGLYDQAEEKLGAAIGVAEDDDLEPGPDKLMRLARLRRDQGRRQAARQLYEEALALAGEQSPEDDLLRARILHELGSSQTSLDNAFARRTLEEALALRRRGLPAGDVEIAATLSSLGLVARNQADMDESLAAFREALAIREAALSPPHPALATSWDELGSLLVELGQRHEGIALLRRAADAWQLVLGPQHPYAAQARSNLAHALRDVGEHVEAETIFRQALAVYESTLPPDHWLIAQTHNALGLVLESQERLAQAEAEYRKALELYDENVPNRDATEFNLASLQRQRGDLDGATVTLRRLLEKLRRERGAEHWSVASALSELAFTSLQAGIPDQAVSYFGESRRVYAAIYREDSIQVAKVDTLLSWALLEQGDSDAAEEALEKAFPVLSETTDEKSQAQALMRLMLGRLRLEQGRPDEAAPLIRAGAEVLGDSSGSFGVEARELLARLGSG